MGCFRIYDNNYLDIDVLANTDVSSENVNFPVTNAYNKQRRSKVWRSAGLFTVTSSNNTIILEETTGVNLTATIAAGTYTTINLFCAAIKTALDDAGVSTYTVICDSTTGFKIKITSNGAGGGGVFNLEMANASTTAETLMGFAATDLTGALNYTADYVRINSDGEWLLWDMGVATNPTGFALIGPRNSPLKISPNAVITLQGNHTDAWGTPVFEQVLTYNDQAIYYENEDGIADEPCRYWRLSIEDQNVLGYIEVGAFMLADYFNPSRGCVVFPFSSRYLDRSVTIYSEGGQTFSDVYQQSQTYNIQWEALQKEDITYFDSLFQVYGTSRPFFVSMDDDGAYTTTVNERVKFVKFVEEPSYSLISPNNFSLSITLREEL